MENELLQPADVEPVAKLAQQILIQLDHALLGRPELHRLVLAGILSRGHILLEGLPGVGKTALVKALSGMLSLNFSRVQFTPDLMPSDILGTHILQETAAGSGGAGGRQLVFQPGPIFTNILLADEINRASPKTQSALLEAMQEHSVTLMGATRRLPEPFFVLASQNPIELEGTYPLPEAQLDRFLFKLIVTDVGVDVLEQIISTRRRGELPETHAALTPGDLQRLFSVMDRVFLPRAVSRYISRLVTATHPGTAEATEQVTKYVSYGGSPRAAIAMAEASRAHALIAGRPTVGFEDVRAIAPHVLNHRIILNYQARFDRVTSSAVVEGLLKQLDEAGLQLHGEVELAAAPR